MTERHITVAYRITLCAPISERFARGFGAAPGSPGAGRRELLGTTARWAGVDEILSRLADLGVTVVSVQARWPADAGAAEPEERRG